MNLWKVIIATLVIYAAGVITGGLLVNHTEGSRDHRRSRQLAEGRLPENRQPEAAPANPTNLPPREWNGSNKLTLPFANPPHKNMSRDFLERLDRDLKLEADQKKVIGKILDEGQKRTKEIWEKVSPEMREVMKTSNEKIREVLNAEQKKRFEELMKRQSKPPKNKEGAQLPPPPDGTNLPPLAPEPPPAEKPADKP